MDFRILGPLEVWEGGQRLPLGGAKQRAVLAILLLEANRVVSTERLIELLWGEEPSETVANSLQVTISQLRKVLEPGRKRGDPYQLVVSQEPGYMIRVTPDQLDLGHLEQLRARASEARSDGDLEAAGGLLRQALTLWRGSAFSDLAQESYVVAEANRLDEIRLRVLEERLDADLALGRHAELIGELEKLVDEHPVRERFRAQLMLALYRSGRQAEAAELFHRSRAYLVDEQGIEPGPELQKLIKAILRQDSSLDLAVTAVQRRKPRGSNLPLRLTSFVGRVQERLELRHLLGHNRLITITGVGGVGKTRLAIQLAHELVDTFNEGVWLTELASVNNGDLVARTVATTLGLREQPERRVEEIMIGYLRTRQVLLVIDNCEHVIWAAAETIEALLRNCPEVSVLATSREALRVEGEVVWSLLPLAVPAYDPATPEAAAQSDAVRLFFERAAGASSIASQKMLRPVVEICRQLDGLPLAIELAAATLRTLPVEELAANLTDRFRLLVAGNRTALERQQTLEASIAWSYELLSEQERTLFRRLAVFSGSFGVEHVEAICSGAPIDVDDTFGLLSRLVGKSLVTFDSSGPKARYGLLEVVHQYARERLAEAGEEMALYNRHLDWYCSLAERASVAIHGPDQVRWFELLDGEQSNLRAALRRGSERGTEAMARLARALAFFWMVRGYLTEGRDWLRLALDTPTGSSLRAQVLTAAGLLACIQSDSTAVRALLSEARHLLELLDDPVTTGMALKLLGWDYWSNGMTSQGLELVEQAIDETRKTGPTWELASHLNDFGFFAFVSGDRSPRPRRILEEALAIARQINDSWVCGLTLESLAQVAADSGDLEKARLCWQECISISIQLRDRFSLPAAIQGFARLAILRGQYERAIHLLAAAARLVADTGVIWPQPAQERVERTVQAARQHLGEEASDAAWRRGHVMTLAEALTYATESEQPMPATASYAPLVS